MRIGFLELLVCPHCRDDLAVADGATWQNDQVEDGALDCTSCGRVYPIIRGVPRFVDPAQYVSAFSFEWSIHRRTQFGPESGSRERFIEVVGREPCELDGKVVLDAGCGTGRFSEVVAQSAGQVVALDLSNAVDVAQENLGRHPNVQVVQASITNMPFRPQTFDFVFSIGVLHHTPDPRASFLSLATVLKPRGEVAVWLYDGHDRTAHVGSDLLRRFTRRLPAPVLYRLCRAAVPLYYLYRLPGLSPLLNRVVTISMHPDPEWRVLDTFDWYAPRYQSKHTFTEVAEWYRAAGIGKVTIGSVPVAVRGEVPAREPVSAY